MASTSFDEASTDLDDASNSDPDNHAEDLWERAFAESDDELCNGDMEVLMAQMDMDAAWQFEVLMAQMDMEVLMAQMDMAQMDMDELLNGH